MTEYTLSIRMGKCLGSSNWYKKGEVKFESENTEGY